MPGNYEHADDQADLLVKKRWEARFWSIATGACFATAIAIGLTALTIGSGGVIPTGLAAVGMMASGIAGVASKFKSDSCEAEYDILMYSIAEHESSSRFADALSQSNREMMEFEEQRTNELEARLEKKYEHAHSDDHHHHGEHASDYKKKNDKGRASESNKSHREDRVGFSQGRSRGNTWSNIVETSESLKKTEGFAK